MSLVKRIFPALAAVVLAAAFACLCLVAPVYASSTTTVTDERLADCASMVSGTSSGWCTIAVHNSIDNYDYYFVGAPTASSDAFHYTLSGSAIVYYGSGGSDRQSNSTMSLVIYSNSISIGGTIYYFNNNEQFASYVYSFTMPGQMEGRISNPQLLYKAILDGKGRSGVGVGFGTPDSSEPVSAASYYASHVSSGIATGQNGGTTTVTTTTTTVTTTTTTAATLPPYPYQTSPPFELPSDWTADYSESAPSPDVGDFSVTTPAEITAPVVPSEVMQGVGFWFTIFTDIVNKYSLVWVVLLTVTVGFIVYMIWGI